MPPPTSNRQARALSALLLLLSALAAVAAFRLGENNEEARLFRAQALFRSEILTDVVPVEALLLEVRTDEFRNSFGHQFELAPVAKDPALFRISASSHSKELSLASLAKLREAIEISLRELATKEIRTLQETLLNVPQPFVAPPATVDHFSSSRRDSSRIESEQRQRAVRLSLEIDDLQAYLNESKEPVWFAERIDESQYQKSKAAAEAAESELRILRKTYKETSQLVAEKKTLLRQAKVALKQNKQHLATILLKSYQQELEELEHEVAARISKKIKPVPSPNLEESPPLASERWMETLSGNLAKDQEILFKRASVYQVDETIVTEELPYRLSLLILWGISGITLILALSAWRAPDSTSGQTQPASAVKKSDRTRILATGLSPGPAKSEPDPNVMKLLEVLQEELGRVHRFLVLGSNEEEARSSVSARLAYTLSSLGQEVRLIDLDLRQKTLSRKLGNAKTAGVIELTSSRGPIEEFLASISGTRIEFAPAGDGPPLAFAKNHPGLKELLKPRCSGGNLVIDAGFSSPISEIANHVEAVICVSAERDKWNIEEQELLFKLRELGLPIWGFIQSESGLHPYG